MALIKCKECGHEISKSAKSCPNCGAKIVRTSGFTKVVAFFMVLGLIGYMSGLANQTKTTKATNSTASSTGSDSSTEPTKIKEPPKPSWQTFTSKDEMTGEFQAFAGSPRAKATPRMTFPYSDVESWVGVGCDKKSTWAYIGFSKSPNLSETKTENGYNIVTTRIKWDDAVSNISLNQDWGSKFLHFTDDQDAILKIQSSNKLKLELKWHGQQSVYFEYTLNGSSKAIAETSSKCAAASK